MRQLIEEFFQAYLVKRDAEEILSYLTEDVISIGTGEHETAMNREAFRALLETEFAELPFSFDYEISDYKEVEAAENVRNVFANILIILLQDEIEMEMDTRFTCTCIRTDCGWKISNMHMSVRSTEQEEGSFFPLLYGATVVGELTGESEMVLLKLVTDSLPGGIMGGYLEEGFPLYTVNDRMLEILGYDYVEFLEASDDKVINVIYEADRERVETEVYRQLKRRGKYEVEYRLITKGGELLWVNDIGRKIIADSDREAIVSIVTDITERMEREIEERNTQRRIKMLAYTDALTGMGNRTAFSEQLMKYCEYDRMACVVADVNNLKHCNDKYGHNEGDRLIIDAAECIREAFEGMGESFRIGGDEFCVLIKECEPENIMERLDKVEKLIAEKNRNRVMQLSVAFGYAVRADRNERAETLINRCDEMMYDVKHRMKNEFPVYREEKISNYLNVLKVLSKSTDDYLFLWDIGRDEFWFFDEIEQDYEVRIDGKPTISMNELVRVIYPADRELLREDFERVAAGEQPEHALIYRWLDRNGEPVWLNGRGQVIPDDKGRPFCMIGSIGKERN